MMQRASGETGESEAMHGSSAGSPSSSSSMSPGDHHGDHDTEALASRATNIKREPCDSESDAKHVSTTCDSNSVQSPSSTSTTSPVTTTSTSNGGATISLEQLEREAGGLIESLCKVRLHFKMVDLKLEEYVVLKILVMTCFKAGDLERLDAGLSSSSSSEDHGDDNAAFEIADIQRRYLAVLRSWLRSVRGMSEAAVRRRLSQLLACLDKSEEAANQLLHSKMFYVPFLLLHS